MKVVRNPAENKLSEGFERDLIQELDSQPNLIKNNFIRTNIIKEPDVFKTPGSFFLFNSVLFYSIYLFGSEVIRKFVDDFSTG